MKLFRSSPSVVPELAAPAREVRVFQSETAELLESGEPTRSYLTVYVLVALLISLVLIAFCVRIDRVIGSTSGEIVTTDPTIVLGALDQSIVKAIDVQEGQKVTKGQLLATLDPTFTTADVGALQAQMAALNAQIARCQAELTQKPFDMAPQTDAVANTYIAAQRQYYLQRKAQYDSQLHAYDEQIAQTRATIVQYQNDQARYGDRAKISQEIEQMRATLAASQFGSRLNLLAATDQKLEVERALEFDRNAITEYQDQLDATVATREAFVQQWFAQVSQELVTAQGNRDAAAGQLTKATKHQDLVRVEAPEDSVVLKIAKLSTSSVMNGGEQPLFYLAPLRSPLEAEIDVAARDIGYIRVGDDTTIKLDAYNYIDHGAVSGRIKSISEGAFNVDDNARPTEPYYKVRVAFNPVSLRDVPSDFRLLPGLTLKGEIHIGAHSLFTYMFSGVVRGYPEPMRGVPDRGS